jgi:hypothetical protein
MVRNAHSNATTTAAIRDFLFITQPAGEVKYHFVLEQRQLCLIRWLREEQLDGSNLLTLWIYGQSVAGKTTDNTEYYSLKSVQLPFNSHIYTAH